MQVVGVVVGAFPRGGSDVRAADDRDLRLALVPHRVCQHTSHAAFARQLQAVGADVRRCGVDLCTRPVQTLCGEIPESLAGAMRSSVFYLAR